MTSCGNTNQNSKSFDSPVLQTKHIEMACRASPARALHAPDEELRGLSLTRKERTGDRNPTGRLADARSQCPPGHVWACLSDLLLELAERSCCPEDGPQDSGRGRCKQSQWCSGNASLDWCLSWAASPFRNGNDTAASASASV